MSDNDYLTPPRTRTKKKASKKKSPPVAVVTVPRKHEWHATMEFCLVCRKSRFQIERDSLTCVK